jgi:hypothetical protein
MPTKIFISWSGELSRKLAVEISNLLPAVIQSVETYFTPDDIAKGARWESDIARQLGECHIGLICLTKDNLTKPWILFEAGALSKAFQKARVCTVLFNVDQADVTPPLSMFQHTKFEREEFKKLFQTINDADIENKLKDIALDRAFDMYWPTFEEPVKEILATHPDGQVPARRDQREILEEILELARNSAVSGDFRSSLSTIEKRISYLTTILIPEKTAEVARRSVVYTTPPAGHALEAVFRKRTAQPSELERRNRMRELPFVKTARDGGLNVDAIAEIIQSSPDIDTVLSRLVQSVGGKDDKDKFQGFLEQRNPETESEINSARFYLDLPPLFWKGQTQGPTVDPDV